ncbi:YveK family protein [Litchfieldia salsa]|uniref:Capsular polysaccharide biosynthesis protein n=1 Tax=Litchfieldia salsa TaxID=930152 RepID=A0A1H0W6V8_9BACI|nr:Wzz/FepE/Etk N-terminal domain-containing protein [Litchfieldia salsa]SDP86480.1 Capsular polysaccharide biosynthesis protein [Litchfieldia salsa]
MEETISLKELFQTIRKRLWMIIILAAFTTGVAGVASYLLITPIYQSSTQILVSQKASDQAMFNQQDIRANLDLISTYTVIIKSPAILELVKEELDLERSTSQLNGQISVGAEGNSQVVKITVEDEDPQKAVDIANTTATVFQDEIKSLMNVDNVSILAEAENAENPAPVKPQPALNMAIALMVGTMIGVGLAFLLEYLDNTIKTEQDIEKLLGIPVLGAVTEIDLAAEGLDRKLPQQRTVRGETIGS